MDCDSAQEAVSVLTIVNWVQCGRYSSGLDLVMTAGGPTGTVTPFSANDSLHTLTED